MPLVLMCGIPASGKTKCATELKSYSEAQYPEIPVCLINEEAFDVD